MILSLTTMSPDVDDDGFIIAQVSKITGFYADSAGCDGCSEVYDAVDAAFTEIFGIFAGFVVLADVASYGVGVQNAKCRIHR